jgi:hypothetical protein
MEMKSGERVVDIENGKWEIVNVTSVTRSRE